MEWGFIHTRIIPRWCIWLDNKKTQKTPPYQAPESRPRTQNIVLPVWVSLYKGKMISQPSQFHNGNHFITKNGVLLVGCSNSPYYSDVIMGVSNHQPHHCLLKRLFRRRWKKISKLRVTGLCEGNSLVAGEVPAQRASNAQMLPFDDVIMFHQ